MEQGISAVEAKMLESNDMLEYKRFLEKCKNSVVQHTLEWGVVLENTGTDKPLFLVAKNGDRIVGVMPCFLYNGRFGSILVSNPYPAGYGGVIARKGFKKEVIYRELYSRFLEVAKQNGCAIATVVTTPFIRDLELVKDSLKPDFVQTDYIQFVDLRKKPAYNRSVKRNIRKALINGLHVSEDDSEANISEWYYRIHLQNMKYLYSDHLPLSFFLDIKKYLTPRKAKFLFLKNRANTLVGGAVLIFHNDVLDVLMRSVDLNYSRQGGTVLLMAYAIKFARERGFKIFNWQSCGFREDGIYEFNRRFGSEIERYYYATKIISDAGPFKNANPEEIEESYKWHYVLPSIQIKKNIWMKSPSVAFLPK